MCCVCIADNLFTVAKLHLVLVQQQTVDIFCVYSFIYSHNALYVLSLQGLSSKSRCKVAMVTPDMKMVCTHVCKKSLCKQERQCWCGTYLRKRCCSSVIGFAWCLWSAESRGRSCDRSWPCGPAESRHTAGTECLHGPRTALQTTWHTRTHTEKHRSIGQADKHGVSEMKNTKTHIHSCFYRTTGWRLSHVQLCKKVFQWPGRIGHR